MNKTLKSILALTMAAAILATTAACSQKPATAATAEGGGFTAGSQPAFVGNSEEVYYLTTFLSGFDYWKTYYEGFKDAARQLGVQTVYQGSDTIEATDQVRVFEQVLALKPDGIMVNPVDGTPFTEAAKKANEAGIPVAVGENLIPDAQLAVYINHNNDLSTKLAADYIGEKLGGSGEIGIFTVLGQENHQARVEAFKKNLEKHWPDIKIVAEANAGHDEQSGATEYNNLVLANPNLKFIFSTNPTAAMGAATAKKESGKNEVGIINFDVNPNVLDFIDQGLIDGAIMPDAYTFGYLGMLSLYTARHNLASPMNDFELRGANGFHVPLVEAGCTVVNKENMQLYNDVEYLNKRGSKGFGEGAQDMKNAELPGYWTR